MTALNTSTYEVTALSDTDRPEAPNKQTLQWKEVVDLTTTPFKGYEEVDFEVDCDQTVFPIEPGQTIKANQTLKLGYRRDKETLEVIGWGVAVDLGQYADIPRLVARRFLELFSKAMSRTATEQEIEVFEFVCQQVDYRSFVAARALPRYREAFLLVKEPHLQIEFRDGSKEKLSRDLSPHFRLLEPGDRFSALFKLDRSGAVVAVSNIAFLQAVVDPDAKEPADTADAPPSFSEVEIALFANANRQQPTSKNL